MPQPEPLTRRDNWTIFSQRCEIRINCGAACFGFLAVAAIMPVTAYVELERFGFSLLRYYEAKSTSIWIWIAFGGGLLIYTARVALRTGRMLRKFSQDMTESSKYYGSGIVVSVRKPYRAGPVAIIDMQDGSATKWARLGTIQWSALEEAAPAHRKVEFWYLPQSGFAWCIGAQSVELADETRRQKKLLWIWLAGIMVVLVLWLSWL